MSALTLSAKLDRTDSNTTWGFRMHGGKDFGCPLSIQRVTPGSLAHKCGLQVGDSIAKIGGTPTDTLRHKEAQGLILHAGNSLELALLRGGAPRAAPAQQQFSAPPPARAPAAPFSPAAAPFSPSSQNYNQAARPFPGGPGSIPVAVNQQYNTPLNMYSVDNVMDSLSGQTRNLGVSDPSPPWRSPGGAPAASPAAPAPRPSPAPAPVPAPAPAPTRPAPAPASTWKPNVPTGPRKMRLGRAGEAKNMSSSAGGRIPICTQCGIAIRGPFVLALDKEWCPDHFNCSNPSCKVPLIGIGFVEEEGQVFCEKDYEQYFAPTCNKCNKAIVGECVNALRNTYHPHCFLCVHCRQPIGTGSFHMEDGGAYCEKDWQAMFQTKCYGCQFPIEPGDRWVEALSQNWHSECFNCSTCQVNLEGQAFFAKSGRPYCKKHAMAGGGR